ncbi:hypothetical protein [Botrimarina sp.]|uniref:hypothetical protein n=1 Tax=Botrimarina sp. TaxID=2795802 RepID=UPI0032EAC14D
MKRTLGFLSAGLMLAASAQAAHLSLIVTGMFDGPLTGGVPKVVELFAVEDIPDLGKWAIGAANNGGGTDGAETILSGSASAGDFLYVVDGGFDTFAAYFGFTPDLIFDGSFDTGGGAAAINGDDAIEVFFDNDMDGDFATSVVGDVFGDINVDGTGQPWDHLDGWAYRNDFTSATDPDNDPTTPSPFVLSDWSFSGVDANDGKTENTGANAFPIGSFTPIPEPAAAGLALVSLAAVAARGRRG